MLNPFTALSTGTTQHIRRDTTKITTTHSHRFLWLSFPSFQIISLSNCEYCAAFKIFTHASHQANITNLNVPDPASPTKAEPLPILSVQQHIDPVRGDHHPQPRHVPRGARLLRAYQHLSGLPRPGEMMTNMTIVSMMMMFNLFI